MPPTIDITLASTRPNMILSARNSPRMSLRRTPTFDGHEKGPLSSTSSRFSFNHLIASPPPSPSLPALVPRHGKVPPSPTPRRCVRFVVWLAGVGSILYIGLRIIGAGQSVPAVGWSNHAGSEYEMVGEDTLPDFPTPVVVSDKRGRAKWTISIPPSYDFPLEPEVYAEMCSATMEVSNRVAELHRHKKIQHAAHFDYYHVDPYYMDVAEAEEKGMLLSPTTRTGFGNLIGSKKGNAGFLVGEDQTSLIEKPVCEKTMTFVMETKDAGLGQTLMMLWSSYGLAQKEGRAFFVDDTRWAYGKYTAYFAPPPTPSCRPPPRHQMVPCPRHASHLVVSAATARNVFGGTFNDNFEDARKMEVFRQKPIFALARTGYEALFKLASNDAAYVKKHLAELKDKVPGKDGKPPGQLIGLHVRHGDKHPMEFQYRDSYIPLYRYVAVAREQLFSTSPNNSTAALIPDTISDILLLASDDPEVYESDELPTPGTLSHPAQKLIRLASKKTLKPPPPAATQGNMFRRFVEENVGWEGGFFAAMFWSLGRSPAVTVGSATPGGIISATGGITPSAEALRLRELVGRAYLLDLAVLGEADGVICTVSSMGCKLLAVMMGWDRAIVEKKWVNIDGDFEWRGVNW